MNAIFKRRSVREFNGQMLDAEQIKLLLKAAMQAPSACNSQPWDFLVINDKELLEKISKTHPYSKFTKNAGCAIIVCAVPKRQEGISDGYFPQDCAAVTENILLQAVEMGLGGCWCGVYPKEERIKEMRELFNVPNEIIPFNVIAIGYAVKQEKIIERFDISKIHTNKW